MLKYTYRKHPQLMPLISPHKNQEETLASCKAFAMSMFRSIRNNGNTNMIQVISRAWKGHR